MPTFKPGDRVLVPWGPEKSLHATVRSLFGSPGQEYARLALEMAGDDGETMFRAITLPVDLLSRVKAS